MEPPLFIWEPNDLLVFGSRSALEAYVEVPDVDVGTAYDAAGRLLRIGVENDRVVVEDAEVVATHQSALADALRRALRAAGTEPPLDGSLPELARLACSTLGWT
jgi:hypothetical protein